MNIAIVSTSDIVGGAARAAYRLKLGLQKRGHDVLFYTKIKRSSDSHVVPVTIRNRMYYKEHPMLLELEKLALSNRPAGMTNYFTIPFEGYDLSEVPGIRDADIVNIHWVDNFLNVESIKALLATGKRVVWTLHDQAPFTGGCHYTAGCEAYKHSCFECPQIASNVNKIPAEVVSEKISLIKHSNLKVIAPSAWMARCAKESTVLGEQDIKVIPNSLETDIFSPLREQSKAATILFGAESLKATRKGFSLLLDAIRKLSKDEAVRDLVNQRRFELVTFGKHAEGLDDCGIPVRYLGHIKKDEELARIYSQATVFVLPSREDNLPNTILESFACGTPVIAFNTGGIPDLVDDSVGRLIPSFDTEALSDAIVELILNPSTAAELGKNARERVLSKYKLDDQAELYESFFMHFENEDSCTRHVSADSQGYAKSNGTLITKNYFVSIYRSAIPMYREIVLNIVQTVSVRSMLKSIPWVRRMYNFLTQFPSKRVKGS